MNKSSCFRSNTIFCIILLAGTSVRAQVPIPTSIPDSLRLQVTFPADGDTVNTDVIRYSGAALPTARVWVQARETRVYASGAFVGMVELQPGFNYIDFRVRDAYGALTDTIRVFREPPRISFPEEPTSVSIGEIKPRSDVFISPGDFLEFEFRGSPGGEASFSLDKIGKNLAMVEALPEVTGGMLGVYRGQLLIPDLRDYKPRHIEFKFRGIDGRQLKFKSPGKVHILSSVVPLVGVTVDSVNLVRTEPGGEIWMEVPQFVKLRILGKQAGVAKVQLAENVVGFMSASSLQDLPPGMPFSHASVRSISTLPVGDWIQIRVNLSDRAPFRIEQLLEEQALEVAFYRARQSAQWISYPTDDTTIQRLQWRQENSDRLVLRVDLNQQQQWGYEGRYVGRQFWLSIRKTPQFFNHPDSVLRGITITVDPGHGGEFDGAVSPTGIFEKNLNLRFSRKVAELLQAAGARAILTRQADTTLALQDRIRIAREANSHIFVSLHNNSISAAADPLRPRGTSTYYTVPQSGAVARDVYLRLLRLGLHPFGRVVSTYYVTRQTGLISFLVEGAFLTHPEDEMLLLDETFVNRMAEAVADGIKDFVKTQLPVASAPTDGFSPP